MPSKTYRIGHAAELLDLKPYVLRYWETEFPQLAPIRTSKGQRLYTEEHIHLLRRIQALLHDEGMTIEGARKKLDADMQLDGVKRSLARELLEIRQLLVKGPDDAQGAGPGKELDSDG
jgi:DNA-binding transcriptional MerR regulator